MKFLELLLSELKNSINIYQVHHIHDSCSVAIYSQNTVLHRQELILFVFSIIKGLFIRFQQAYRRGFLNILQRKFSDF